MARTNIKVFDEGYKNIMNDDEYNLSVQRTRGVTPGIADPLMHNKLYRQVSVMSTALAQYIVDQGYDCLDTDLAEIAGNIKNATIKTMLDRLKEGNLILGDGITANGNFNINRKLTVTEIDVKNKITIAGKEPLDASALQKIQDQIIAPSQVIVVNKFIGNDDTGNGTNEKLYKTLDKAISQIKSGVPMIWMYLQGKINGTQEENTYTCTQCIYLGSNQNLSLVMSYGDYYLKGVRLNLVVPYVKIPSNYDYSMSRYNYVYGNILINGGNHISIECINLVFPDNTHQDAINYTNCITRFSTSLNLSFVNLSITKHSFLALMNGTSLQLAINKNSHVYGKGLFIRSVGSIDHVIDWDGTVNISGETTDVTTKTHVITSAIIEGYSSLDLGISSVGQHGISNGFYIVFKNF